MGEKVAKPMDIRPRPQNRTNHPLAHNHKVAPEQPNSFTFANYRDPDSGTQYRDFYSCKSGDNIWKAAVQLEDTCKVGIYDLRMCGKSLFPGVVVVGTRVEVVLFLDPKDSLATDEDEAPRYCVKSFDGIKEATDKFTKQLDDIVKEQNARPEEPVIVDVKIRSHGNAGYLLFGSAWFGTDEFAGQKIFEQMKERKEICTGDLDVLACTRGSSMALEHLNPNRLGNIFNDKTKEELLKDRQSCIEEDQRQDAPRRELLEFLKQQSGAHAVDGTLGPCKMSSVPDPLYAYRYSEYPKMEKMKPEQTVVENWLKKQGK